jgi:sec-independent protein translocase protein TatA
MGLDNPLHLAFLLMILLMVFGAKRLPEIGRSLGTGLRGFKDSINGHEPAEELSVATVATSAGTETAAVEPEPVSLHPAVEPEPVSLHPAA